MKLLWLLLLTDQERTQTQLQVIDGMLEAGMAQQALAACTDLRNQGQNGPELDLIQARALDAVGMDVEAENLLLSMLKHQKRNAQAWAELGLARADQNNLPGAIEALKKAASLSPDNADIQNNLGFVLMAAGELRAAEDSFHRALLLDPGSLRTRNNLGFVLARQGRDDEALEAFRAASSEAEAQYNLAVACEQRNDRSNALIHYQAALAASPGWPLAITAVQHLLAGATP